MPIDGYFDVVFGEAGNLTTVPDDVQPDGSVSYEQGWGPYYQQDPAVDPSTALLIDRAETNQLFHDVTSAIQGYQQFGTPPFITTTMNGGTAYSYPKYARVSYDDGGGLKTYQSLKAANTDLPSVAGSWQVDEANSLGTEAQTGTNYALTAADNARLIQRSNTGTPMVDTLPGTSGALANGWYAYIENTDSAGSLTVNVGSGGTISVGAQPTANTFVAASGETWFVISGGTGNYTAMRVSAGSLHTKPNQGNRKKFKAGWASNTTAIFTADSIVLYDVNGNSRLVSSFNKTLNTATSGIGGLDTGSLAANQAYYTYALLNPTTGVQSIIMSLNGIAPALSSGYTYYALLTAAVYLDSSRNIRGFTINDYYVQHRVGANLTGLPVVVTGAQGDISIPTYVAASVVVATSPLAAIIVGFCSISNVAAMVAPSNLYGAIASTTNPPPIVTDVNASNNIPFTMQLESSNIYVASNGAAFFVGILGYWEEF